jgi:hypothetical protein
VNVGCDSLKNEISWDFPAYDSCYSDVVRIRIYYSTTSTGDMQVLSEFPIGSQSNYVHILENSVALLVNKSTKKLVTIRNFIENIKQ